MVGEFGGNRPAEGCCSPGTGRWKSAAPMSDYELTAPKPLVLRVEISAEQAASLAPFLGTPGDTSPLPSLPTPHRCPRRRPMHEPWS